MGHSILNQKEVQKRLKKLKIKLIGKYKGVKYIHKLSCRCGNSFKKDMRYIFVCFGQNLQISCGCHKKLFRGKGNKFWKGYADISGKFYKSIKRCSNRKSRKLPFNLSIQYLWKLFLKQKRKCALSGVPLKFDGYKDFMFQTASLDRIDSNKGYIKGNVQWVHKNVNIMKQAFDQKDFIKFCKLIALNN